MVNTMALPSKIVVEVLQWTPCPLNSAAHSPSCVCECARTLQASGATPAGPHCYTFWYWTLGIGTLCILARWTAGQKASLQGAQCILTTKNK